VTNEPLAVRALWPGAPADYELDFGDPAREPVRVRAGETRPVRHAYSKAGRYVASARPLDGGERPTNAEIVVRAVLSPQAELTRTGRGGVRLDVVPVELPVRHRIDWGDGSGAEYLGPDQFTAEHQYIADLPGRVITLTDEPTQRVLQIPVPRFPEGRPDPVFAVHGTQSPAGRGVRVLFAPPATAEDFDHRSVAHEIDWGDRSLPELIPAGRAWAEHEYGADWATGTPPVIAVTDPDLVTTVSAPATPLRATYATLTRPADGSEDVDRWRCVARRLPTRGPSTKYVVHQANAQIRRIAPAQDGEDFFEFEARWRPGMSSVDVVGAGGASVAVAPLRSGTLAQPQAAYDWDLAHPHLITCTPWVYGGSDSWFAVDWGDGTDRDRLSAAGVAPRVSHWYEDIPPRALMLLPEGDPARATACFVGPCSVRQLVREPSNRFIAHLDLDTLDVFHPVRIDWGDGTPVLRHYPAALGGRVSHTYSLIRAYTVVVYAPFQAPIRVALTTTTAAQPTFTTERTPR
jgi:hypothetical protein